MSSSGHRQTTSDDLVERLYTKVGHHDSLSLTDHLSAGNLLCRLRDRLVVGDRPSTRAAIKLLASGSALHRRCTIGGTDGDDDDNREAQEEAQALVRASAVRIFVLLSAMDLARRSGSHHDADAEARRVVEFVAQTDLWSQIRDPPSRRKKQKTDSSDYDTETAEVEEEAEEDDAAPADEGWAAVLRVTSGEVARHCLRIGACSLDDDSWEGINTLMPLFFRNSALNMQESLLLPDGDTDFVSLTTSTTLQGLSPEMRAKKLLGVAQAGESEAGQQIVRDLMLSFLLPAGHVGVRRTLLLTRAASTQAGVDYPALVARSHDVAMTGTEWMFEHGTDQLERLCCLLAGVAVLTTKGDDDPIRKADAFNGRLQLPCFETRPPDPAALRIVLIPHCRRWILYRLDKRGRPKVASSQRGFRGLCDAVLCLVASL
jgi:hypothetical protein